MPTRDERRLVEAAKTILREKSASRNSSGERAPKSRERRPRGRRSPAARRTPQSGDWRCKVCTPKNKDFYVYYDRNGNTCPRCGGHKGRCYGGKAKTADKPHTDDSSDELTSSETNELRQRIDQLEKQNTKLRQAAEQGVQPDVETIPERCPALALLQKEHKAMEQIYGAAHEKTVA